MSHYTELVSDPPSAEPLVLVNQWLAESWRLRQQPNPNAMVLATVSPEGEPSARVVLCKEIVAQPGYLVFYTNYHSRKARELVGHPRAAAVMHWDHLQRQARIEGPVILSPAADSDAYFASRPWQSRLGAWASEQSEPIGSRRDLEAALAAAAKRFGTPVPAGADNASTEVGTSEVGTAEVGTAAAGTAPGGDFVIPRPPHWGGLQLWAQSVELWVEGAARIHDRMRWTRSLAPSGVRFFAAGPWTVTRLQP